MRQLTLTAIRHVRGGILFCLAALALSGPWPVTASASQPTETQSETADPLQNLGALRPGDFSQIYPNGLYFQIRRNGEVIGFHKARAVRKDGILTIENHTVMNTRVFFALFPYRLEYKSESRWQDDQFLEFAAQVEEQGETTRISLSPRDGRLTLRVGENTTVLSGQVVPSPHWLSVYIKGAGLLHGVSGEIWNIGYDHDTTIMLQTALGNVEARKYTVVNSEISAAEWYDNRGRWLAMAFEAPDGSRVDYECVECGQRRAITLSQLDGREEPRAE